MQAIDSQLSEHRETLQSTVAYPLPQFPGKERSFILETLLRTKLEPNVEEWIEEGESITLQRQKGAQKGLSDEERNALWQWAPGAANKEARKQKWGADFTLEEKQNGIENVITGLRRDLIEPTDDDGDEVEEEDEEEEYEVTDDEDDDKMEVEQTKTESRPGAAAESQPAMPIANQLPLQTVHKFMTTGR